MEIANGVSLDFLGHSGFLVSVPNGSEKRIFIDPFNLSDSVGKADFILITHSHYDHCSIKDIEKIAKNGTVVIVPADAQSKITKIEGVQMEVIEIGDELVFGNFRVEAVPAYNISKDFHPKSEGWAGYVLKIGNIIIYHSGDSDKIPEMQRLSGYGKQGNTFITLLPVSGKYVMDADEAAELASLLNPTLAIPMHYGAGVVGTIDDAQRFVKACEQYNVKTIILEKL